MIQLVVPAPEYLLDYKAALERGWSPDNLRPEAAQEELEQIRTDVTKFLSHFTDLDAKAGDVKLPDGSMVKRLPGFRRWIWDDGFCGSVGLRWQKGTEALPEYCLGHIGYAVVPWKQKQGYATQAVKLLLPEAKALGLSYIEITTEPDNLPSQKVILANGGKLIERFTRLPAYGGTESLRYRIDL